jgi:hypothetical protein
MMIIIKVKITSHLKIRLRKDLRIHLFLKRKVTPNLADILNTKRIRKIKKKIVTAEKVNFNSLVFSLIKPIEIDLLIKIMIKFYIQS